MQTKLMETDNEITYNSSLPFKFLGSMLMKPHAYMSQKLFINV